MDTAITYIIQASHVLSNIYDQDDQEFINMLLKEQHGFTFNDIMTSNFNKINSLPIWKFVRKYDFHNKDHIKLQLMPLIDTLPNDETCDILELKHKTCLGETDICKTAVDAAKKGHLFCLKLLEKSDDPAVCSAAASCGHLDCLMYAHENGCPWDSWTCSEAASFGHLNCLKYAHENGCELSCFVCIAAASCGNLDCLKYIHENGYGWDHWASCNAARFGYIDCLVYLHENGCPLSVITSQFAAEGGHLDCLRYLHENGCPWDKSTCEGAAEYGHLECLKYAHENGCPWDYKTRDYAIRHEHLDCLKYAQEMDARGCIRHILHHFLKIDFFISTFTDLYDLILFKPPMYSLTYMKIIMIRYLYSYY
jgi:hypothetical protein